MTGPSVAAAAPKIHDVRGQVLPIDERRNLTSEVMAHERGER
jgi:hypothetical protein